MRRSLERRLNCWRKKQKATAQLGPENVLLIVWLTFEKLRIFSGLDMSRPCLRRLVRNNLRRQSVFISLKRVRRRQRILQSKVRNFPNTDVDVAGHGPQRSVLFRSGPPDRSKVRQSVYVDVLHGVRSQRHKWLPSLLRSLGECKGPTPSRG